MAHEITRTDRLVLNSGRPAWHGLGTVVDQALSPTEAVRMVLGWEPVPEPVFVKNADGSFVEIPAHRANRRNDNGEVLGIVSDSYKLIQNYELAGFAEAMVGADRAVQVETAGSLRGGRRVFILCKLPVDVCVGKTRSDVTKQYVLLSNTHDGTAAAFAFWTSIRVVCNNTLTMAAGANFSGAAQMADQGRAVRIQHSGEIEAKMAEARKVLGLATTQAERFARIAEQMASTFIPATDRALYFAKVYAATYGEVPEVAKNEQDEVAMMRRDRIIGEWTALLDDEKQRVDGIAGSVWSCLQAVTQWHDHTRSGTRISTDTRQHSNLFGVSARDKRDALQVALAAI